MEPVLAEIARPIAERILAAQEQADLANYPKRFSSEKLVQDEMARLAHRRDEDLPPLPVDLVRGTPDSVLDPVAKHALEVKPTVAPQAEKVVGKVVGKAEGELVFEPTEDPVLARLRAFKPDHEMADEPKNAKRDWTQFTEGE